MKLRGRRLLSTAAYTAWAARRTFLGRRFPATATWATCGVLRARAWGSRLGCVRRCCGAVAWDLVGAVPGVKKNFGGAIIVGTRGEYSVAAPGDVRDAIGGDNSGGAHVRARRRTMIFPARKKGETAARSQMGRTGGLAWSALSVAEEHTGGTVADRTFVGRSVVVLLASREVEAAKSSTGRSQFSCSASTGFLLFFRRGGGGERA